MDFIGKLFIIFPIIGFLSGLLLIVCGVVGLISPQPDFETGEAIFSLVKGAVFMGINWFLGKIIYDGEFR
jgi:hypothetical protein